MTVEEREKEIRVTALRRDPPMVFDESTPVREVVRVMLERRFCYALLTREGRLTGVFTERDAVRKAMVASGAMDGPVGALMTPNPICVREEDPIQRAVAHMRRDGVRHVPVVDDQGRVVGCVCHRDIIRYLVQHCARHVLNLPPDPEQVARTPEGA